MAAIKKVMEDLDFSGLLANCSDKGRTGYNPIMMYAVITYANMRGIRSIDRIVDLCERDIAFIWLTQVRKPKLQQLYEELEHCGQRLMHYKECFEIMGKDRNSYSKTDLEATFMRMKEDHMLNGQLKPTYNVQITVENYFIVHCYVSNVCTDYNTLIPIPPKHKEAFGEVLEEVTVDSGYCSEKNLLYLKENKIDSYIKLQDHEKRKTRAYSKDIGKYYNMKTMVFEDEQVYICHDGREMRHINTEKKKQNGYTQTKVYKEFMLFAIGRNINKYHRFLYAKLKKFEGKPQEKTA